jgi:hypothetical protein
MIALAALLVLQDEWRRVDKDAHCLECHEDALEEVRGSVHEKEGCIACHGPDEINVRQTRGNPHRKMAAFKSWRGRNLTEDCGACHIAVLEALKPSKHYVDTRRATGSMKKGCIDCHGEVVEGKGEHGHRVLKATLGLFNDCRQCHDPASRENIEGLRFKKDVEAFEGFAAMAQVQLRAFEPRAGIPTRALADAIGAAGRTRAELRTTQHGMNFKAIEEARARSAAPLHEAYNKLADREREFASRWTIAAPFLLLVGAGIALTALRRRRPTS